MAFCELIGGYAIQCDEAVGGIDAVYFTEFENVTIVTDASGAVSAITKASGKRFWKFEVPTRSTANAQSNPIKSVENGTLYFDQVLDFPINKRDATTRNIIMTLAKNRLVAVTLDKDGTYRMYGRFNGLFMGESKGQTGAGAGDANGYTLNFTGQEREDFFTVPSVIGLALETPGS